MGDGTRPDTTFHHVDDDAIIACSTTDPTTGDTVLAVCALDSHGARSGTTALDMPALGLDRADRFSVHDEVTGETYEWGRFDFVRLEPWHHVAHVLHVRR